MFRGIAPGACSSCLSISTVNKMNSDQIFIFTGPTLPPEIARRHLDAIYLPPVKLGDVYRISELYQPRIIGSIDGSFNQAPAVWHKEIHHAMSQGTTVFGASSMGALRAAEMDQLGMIGCGKIYQAYQSGVLPPFIDEPFEDDDEVAVIHSPAELGYLAASDAMVNIRFSLAKAMQHDVIDRATCHQLISIAKKLFYPERNYASILEISKNSDLPAAQLEALQGWLEQHSVDQKQLDAIELLEKVARYVKMPPDTQAPGTPPFQHTSQWQAAIDEIAFSHHAENPVLNELRLQGDKYFQVLDQALNTTRTDNKLQAEETREDLSKHHRSPEQLGQLYAQHWQQKYAGENAALLSPMQSDQRLLEHLQQSGALDPLESRARNKQSRSQQLQTTADSSSLSEIDRLQLCDWYFAQQLGIEMPNQLEVYVTQLGLEDSDSFYDMILDEYIYLNSEA
jgi:hypothetical protein